MIERITSDQSIDLPIRWSFGGELRGGLAAKYAARPFSFSSVSFGGWEGLLLILPIEVLVDVIGRLRYTKLKKLRCVESLLAGRLWLRGCRSACATCCFRASVGSPHSCCVTIRVEKDGHGIRDLSSRIEPVAHSPFTVILRTIGD